MYRNLLLIIRLCCHYVIRKFPNFIAHALSISLSVHAIRVMHVHQIGQDLPVATYSKPTGGMDHMHGHCTNCYCIVMLSMVT